MFTQDYIFLSASTYSMTDEKTGEIIQGTTVYLVPLKPSESDREAGARPQKFNQPFDAYKKLYSQLEYLQQYSFSFEARAVGNSVRLVLIGLAQ